MREPTMKELKNISPLIFSVITLICFSIIGLLPIDEILLKASFSDFHAEYTGLGIKMTFVFLVSQRLVRNLNIESMIGLSPKCRWENKSLNLIPVYLIILGALSVISKDLAQINLANVLLLLAACLAVGFAEEYLFRGVLQSLFLKKYINNKRGILISVFIPALIFGLFHFVNLTRGGPAAAVIIQVVFATFIGFFFGAMVLKTNKITPVALTHGLINFFFSLAFLPGLQSLEEGAAFEDGGVSIAPIILTLPLLIVGFFIVRKISKEDVAKKLNESFQS